MALTTTLRQRFENLMLGTYAPSATFYIATNRFRLHDRDAGTLEQNVDNTIDRAFQIDFGPATADPSFNPIDGVCLYTAPVTIRVGYLYTHSGDGMTENATYDSGTGYVDDVVARANTDMHDILRTVTWHENWGSLAPALFGVTAKNFIVRQLATKIIAELSVVARFQATTTTSYL
jgi:hypothetical protein